jgi:hypothetical protein
MVMERGSSIEHYDICGGQEIGLEQGTATFHKISASSSFWQKRALFYWSL